MVILHEVTKWKHCLWGRHFKIHTNYISLKHLLHYKMVVTPAQHLWLIKLLGYDYEIEYRQGKENMATNILFRVSSGKLYALTVSMISTSVMEEIRRSWEKDSSIQIIIRDFSYH